MVTIIQADNKHDDDWLFSDNGNDTGPFTWSNLTGLGSYLNWATGNPVNTPGSQDCAYIDTREKLLHRSSL